MKWLFREIQKQYKEIYSDFVGEVYLLILLIQRRKVWNDQDNVRLIGTILMELVMPECFLDNGSESDTGISFYSYCETVNRELVQLWIYWWRIFIK